MRDEPKALKKPIEILHIEDNPGDIKLTQIALSEFKVQTNVNVVTDGDQALAFLRRMPPFQDSPRPDLILLDLNIPKLDGRDVLREIKGDLLLRRIPVVILTSSEAEQDINFSYDLHANSYIRKSESLDEFMDIFAGIERFWLQIAKLPVV